MPLVSPPTQHGAVAYSPRTRISARLRFLGRQTSGKQALQTTTMMTMTILGLQGHSGSACAASPSEPKIRLWPKVSPDTLSHRSWPQPASPGEHPSRFDLVIPRTGQISGFEEPRLFLPAPWLRWTFEIKRSLALYLFSSRGVVESRSAVGPHRPSLLEAFASLQFRRIPSLELTAWALDTSTNAIKACRKHTACPSPRHPMVMQ